MVVRCTATVVMLGTAWYAIAQDAQAAYPSMEDRSSESALARSAAPESISHDAESIFGSTIVVRILFNRLVLQSNEISLAQLSFSNSLRESATPDV
jgi:hypothetical protein